MFPIMNNAPIFIRLLNTDEGVRFEVLTAVKMPMLSSGF
jgi:hypothetical protein